MGNFSKGFLLLLVVILAVSILMMIKSASAQSIPKPSVPEFSLKFVDASYFVPTTYSTDPYTGANVTHPSYFVDNRTIEVIIKNQPFTRYANNGQIIDLYFNMRTRGYYEENWTNSYSIDDVYPNQTNTNYTVLIFRSQGDGYFLISNSAYSSSHAGFYAPSNGKVDFQMEAMIGSIHRDASQFLAPWGFYGETSGWSNTQTITIPETSTLTTPTLNPTSTPKVPEVSLLVVIPLIFGAFTIALTLRHRRTISQNELNV
jgi:hypothetical protein